MGDYTGKSVSMKCRHCGYEEDVPQRALNELNELSDDKFYQMTCPECNDMMFEKGTLN